jgi:hypothetical protein
MKDFVPVSAWFESVSVGRQLSVSSISVGLPTPSTVYAHRWLFCVPSVSVRESSRA